MEIEVLGGLVVSAEGERLHLGTPKQQLVLAMLALDVGRLVTVGQLVDELWPDDPPRSAIPNARTYAANLRRLLSKVPGGVVALVREQGGYRLRTDEARIDLHRLVAQCRQARQAATAGHVRQAVALLTGVIDKWSGPLLAGLPLGPYLRARAESVDRERQAVVELLAHLHLGTGRADLAVALLQGHAAQHPVREAVQALLMRALIEKDDLSGALAVYEVARDALADQLGVSPGAELERLRRSAVQSRSASRRDSPEGPVEGGPPVRPDRSGPAVNALPRVVPDFVGRREVVRRILDEIDAVGVNRPAIRIIDGMAGCGKTTLVVHLAALLADRCPDGQLYIDLHGQSVGGSVPPAAALVTLLRQLGVPAGRIPDELPERVELWRREIALRRVVVVLDNAADTEQVEPLLPSSGGAVVFVTSRRRLLALSERPPVSLPVLSEQEGLSLLEALAGGDRVRADVENAVEVVRLCGLLPLAIRLAGTRLAHRPAWQMADMVRRLARKPTFLPQLRAEARTVVKAFAESYEPLDEPAKKVFRSFGLVAGDHLDLAMLAALSGRSLDETADVIDELVDRHLVEELPDARYRLHDLMRQYAYELGVRTDPADARAAAVADLLDHLVHSAVQICEPVEEPQLAVRQLRLSAPRRPDLLALRRAGDLEWLEGQRSNLDALVRQAGQEGHDGYAWRLARAAWRFYYLRSYFDDISATHREGLAAANRSGDRHAIALMHNYLASACVRTGAFQEALGHLNQVVAIRAELGDPEGADRARVNLGVLYWLTGRLQEALEINQSALRTGALDSLPILANVGLVLRMLGRYEESLAVHRRHLFIARLRGERFQLCNALGHVGGVRYRMGQGAQAERLLRAALALRDRSGHEYARAETLSDLAATYRQLGRYDEALARHRAAVEAAASSGERHIQAEARNELALTLWTMGRHEESAAMYREALDIATRIAHPYEQGRALDGLAEHLVAVDVGEARRYWRRALAIFERMRVPEQDRVRRRLAESAE